MIRQAASGLMTMGGGFVIDTFSGRRGLLLAGALFPLSLAAQTGQVTGSVVDADGRPVGLVDVQDLISMKVVSE